MNAVPTWQHPIWHRGYRIYHGTHFASHCHEFAFTHIGFDAGDDFDVRYGYADTVEAAKREIDEQTGDA